MQETGDKKIRNIDVCDLLFVVVTVNYCEVDTMVQFSKSCMICHHNSVFVHLLLFANCSLHLLRKFNPVLWVSYSILVFSIID